MYRQSFSYAVFPLLSSPNCQWCNYHARWSPQERSRRWSSPQVSPGLSTLFKRIGRCRHPESPEQGISPHSNQGLQHRVGRWMGLPLPSATGFPRSRLHLPPHKPPTCKSPIAATVWQQIGAWEGAMIIGRVLQFMTHNPGLDIFHPLLYSSFSNVLRHGCSLTWD